MVAPFDVFAVVNGESQWVGCADTAMKALSLAVDHGEGSYFVYSQQNGYKGFYEVTRAETGAFVARELSR